jgi:hypothetical protein
MIKITITGEAEKRLESLREKMAARGFEMDIEEVLEMVVDLGIIAAERAANTLMTED